MLQAMYGADLPQARQAHLLVEAEDPCPITTFEVVGR